MEAFQRETKELLAEMRVDTSIGLSDEQVIESTKAYGSNEFTKGKKTTFLKRVLNAFKEPMLILLIIAGLITLAVNLVHFFTTGKADFIECVGIFLAIALTVAITVIMEGKSAKAFEALNKIKEDVMVKVLRNGKPMQIPQNQLVVGDIVYIATGDKIMADGRLIEANDLKVDESALTGESMAVTKNASTILDDAKTPVAERINMLYSGCFVNGGNGLMLVTGVGDKTEFGKIAGELNEGEKTSTPLQEKLAKLGKIISIFGGIVAGLVFIIQLSMLFINGGASFVTISEAFITSIVLMVASVPEGLPAIVAVSLAINIIKMSKQNALVKKMVACETVGSINVICSDKTGTLTENKMTVKTIYNGVEIEPNKNEDVNLINNFCINTTADVEKNGDKFDFIGNPTECALLASTVNSNVDYRSMRKSTNVLHCYPFSSETKNMTTVAVINGKSIAFTKGSPEKITLMCKIDGKKLEEINEKIKFYQQQAGRIIAFAHKEITKAVTNFENAREQIESEMVFDGFVVITDPLRKEVYEAVLKCKKAGIEIKMLTGDNIITATAIASELKIIDENHIAVEAKELEEMTEEQFKEILPRIAVIARSTPVIKMRVVNALKQLGNVVAVTGDGINDAPAIKNADVGIAMGIAGTEVTREASDVVLLDDSFATIVKSVHWGRGIYENFQRFIQFQLTVNLSSVLVILLSIVVGLKSPFTALQILWINIIMDGPPALTLGLEPIRSDLMARLPIKRNASIVTKDMFSKIILNGLFVTLIFMLQSGLNILGGTEAEQSTILFTFFVVAQLFNAFNCREMGTSSIFKQLANNKMMLLVFAITFGLQVIIVQFAGAVFKTVPLGIGMWLKIIGLALSVIFVAEIFKVVQKGITKLLPKLKKQEVK